MADGPRRKPPILLLGGTAEAVALAGALAGDFAVTYSLAGRTRTPALPENVAVRTGGFGGADALADWIAAHRIAAVVDATHPFAAGIAANAAAACARTATPRLKFVRAAWEAMPGDDWRPARDAADAAAQAAALGGTAFLAIGRQELSAFAGIATLRFVVRTVDPLPEPPLPDAVCLTGRGPFSTDSEEATMRTHGVGFVVSKNAGGAASYGKIAAARRLGLPVVMIARPPLPPGDKAADLDYARAWLEAAMEETGR